MKNKLMILALAVALLVGLVPPSSAMANITETTADDVKYRDIEDFMQSAGYVDFVKNEGSIYVVFNYGTDSLYVCEFTDVSELNPYMAQCVRSNGSYYYVLFNDTAVLSGLKWYKYYNYAYASQYGNYSCVSSGTSDSHPITSLQLPYQSNAKRNYYGISNGVTLLYSDLDIYYISWDGTNTTRIYRSYDTLVFESSVDGIYSFPSWCADAGLNALASTNESPTKIPYSYNGYWHIVRKTASGKWLLTTIGSTLGEAKMSLRLSEDLGSLIINEFSGDDSFVISVRQYEYDTDGWKVRTFDTYDFDDLTSGKIALEVGSGIDDYRVLAYSNTDIYTHDGMSVYMSASTEYFEPTVEQPTPPIEGGDGGDSSESGGTGSSGGSIGGGTRGDSYGISVDVISVYEKCWNGSDVLGKLYKGDVVEVLEVYDSPSYVNLWYRVNCEIDGVEVEGWINGGIVYDDGETDSGSSGEDSGSDADELVEALSGVVDMISVVPLMIGAVFSFLPTWCLVVVGASFSFMCIYLVVKLIRG